MLKSIGSAATKTVGRDWVLASIAIVAAMANCRQDSVHALRIGGWLFLGLCLVFSIRARLAPVFPYRLTDVWCSLEAEHRPNDRFAQLLIGRAIRIACFRMALASSLLAAVLLAASLLVGEAERRTPV